MKVFVGLLLLFILVSDATLTLPNFFSSNMVLQRAPLQAKIWGKAEAGSPIGVSLNNVALGDALTGSDGKWSFTFPSSYPAGGPHQIQLINRFYFDTVIFDNVLFGDVWLCVGQSNMELNLIVAYNASTEIADSINYPNLRVFPTASIEAEDPRDDAPTRSGVKWEVSSPTSVGNQNGYYYFSALCYFFGRENNKKTGVPQGLIQSAWGGTIIEAWSSPDALGQCFSSDNPTPDYGPFLNNLGFKETSPSQQDTKRDPNSPSVLFNGMIHPFIPLSLRGVTWYQGESNAGNPNLYACRFPALINDYRSKFLNPELSFYFVQLAPYNSGGILANFRSVQEQAITMHRVAQTIAIDTWDPDSPTGEIHPRNKQTLGFRMSLASQAIDYGFNVDYFGPRVNSVSTSQAGDNYNTVITFASVTPDGVYVGPTEKCTSCCNTSPFDVGTATSYISAQVIGVSGNNITVATSTAYGVPLTVSHAWTDIPQCAVYDYNKLVGAPFRVNI